MTGLRGTNWHDDSASFMCHGYGPGALRMDVV